MPGISPGASQALMITCSRVGQGQALGWGRMGQAGDQNSREHRSQGCLAQVPQGTTWEPVRQARVIHVHGWQAPRRQSIRDPCGCPEGCGQAVTGGHVRSDGLERRTRSQRGKAQEKAYKNVGHSRLQRRPHVPSRKPRAGQAPAGELTHFPATLTAFQGGLGAQRSAALHHCYKSTNRFISLMEINLLNSLPIFFMFLPVNYFNQT